MRTKALFILIGFILLIGLTGFFWGNSLISWGLEKTLETVIGAEVDLDGFRLNLFDLSVRIDGIRITNPADTWKNLIDTKNISFKLAPEPLFQGKTVIDEITVADLTFNTPRRTDGKLKRKKLPGSLGKAQTKLNQSIAQMPVLKPETIAENLDISKITANYQFRTDLSAGRIKTELTTYREKWASHLDDLKKVKVEINNLDQRLTQIKKYNSKNVLELKKQLDLLKETTKTAEQIRAEIKTAANEFKKDNQALDETIEGLKREAEADYQSLLALAKVPDLGSINYTEALLGKALLNVSDTILKLADELSQSLPVKMENPPKEKHPRGGQEITFPGRKTYPRFLIKKIAISGKGTPGSVMNGFYAKGTVTGITSEPPLYGLPLTVSVFAAAPNQAILELDGNLNHLTPAFQDQLNLKLKGLPLPQINLSDSDYLPAKLSSGKADIDATLEMTPDSLRLRAVLTGADLKADYTSKPQSDDLVVTIVRKALADLSQITIHYQLERRADQWEMKLSSNFDQMIAARLKESIGAQVAGFTRELRAKVDAKLLEETQALKGVKQQYQKEIATKLDEFQMQLEREERELAAAKKELEAKIAKELGQLKLKF